MKIRLRNRARKAREITLSPEDVGRLICVAADADPLHSWDAHTVVLINRCAEVAPKDSTGRRVIDELDVFIRR